MAVDKKINFDTASRPDWCPGCGNFGIQVALKRAFSALELNPDNVAMVSDIGCSGKMPHWVNTYGLHSLHGRAVACATGVKLANRDLTVVVSAGDGGAYGIGIGHLVHAIRRNVDMTVIVHNNQVYGLTKGQMTPTSDKGYVSPSSPFGVVEEPVNPLLLALSMGGTFVARGYAGDANHLTALIVQGIKHKGFSLIDVYQPCVSFNKDQTFAYYASRVHKLDENHDTSDWEKAARMAKEIDKMPIGVFYQEEKPIYEDLDPGKAKLPAAKLPIDNIEIADLMAKFV